MHIDDLAASAGLSKQFVNDLELGKVIMSLVVYACAATLPASRLENRHQFACV